MGHQALTQHNLYRISLACHSGSTAQDRRPSGDHRAMIVRHGYALPLTLAAIIVIALVAAMAAEQVRSSTRTVTQLVDQMRSRTEMVSAEQTLIYTLLTEPMTMNGISIGGQSDVTSLVLGTGGLQDTTDVIRANGQAYRYGEGSVVARIYDDHRVSPEAIVTEC